MEDRRMSVNFPNNLEDLRHGDQKGVEKAEECLRFCEQELSAAEAELAVAKLQVEAERLWDVAGEGRRKWLGWEKHRGFNYGDGSR